MQGAALQSSWLWRWRGGLGGLLLGLDQRLGGDTLQQRLGVGAQAASLFADAAVGREGGHGTVQDAVPLDVVGLEILLLVAGLRLESHAEGADLVELDGHGVEQVLLHDVEELYEHGGDVGARDGTAATSERVTVVEWLISSASWRVVTVPRLTALPYHLPLMLLSFRWH